jgi:cbb3-type cytochrome oxidase subunit 3
MSSTAFLSIFRNLQEDEIQYPVELHDEGSFLWLLIIDLLIFIGLTFYAYTSSKKMEESNANPDELRYKFMKSLIYANGGKSIIN